jgi:hypothetical protein
LRESFHSICICFVGHEQKRAPDLRQRRLTAMRPEL